LPQKVIIDADPGIGDALAIAVALFDPEVDVIGLTATAGCVSGRDATRNLQTILEQLDPPKWPRIGSCDWARPSVAAEDPAAVVATSSLNGEGGLGDCTFGIAELHHPRDSAKLMIDLARNAPNEVTLLTLGPLTNVALAIERAPDFLSQLNGLFCLGGAVQCSGDATAAAEFNICGDPESARAVLRSAATKTLVPLDVSEQVELTFEQFDAMSSVGESPLCRFLQTVLPFAFRAHHEVLGVEGIRLNELAALAALAQPRLVSSKSMTIDVETAGHLTRGMTVFDRRAKSVQSPNIDVVLEVDAQGVLDYLQRTVRNAGR
jgi:inosine-uridine nucleoside N-ribohydrolase